jgi:hypothetical protein
MHTKQARLLERVKLGNEEVVSQLVFESGEADQAKEDDPFF